MRIQTLIRVAVCPVLALALGSLYSAGAQSSHGYVYAAPGGWTLNGGTSGRVQAGGGGEALIWHGFGAGAELAVNGPSTTLRSLLGVFSANGYWHFLRGKQARLDPFLTGGYTLIFRSEQHANLGNFGGGVNYWRWTRVGLKFEFRDQVWNADLVSHLWGVRFGLAFR